jgi:hypothetical protein
MPGFTGWCLLVKSYASLGLDTTNLPDAAGFDLRNTCGLQSHLPSDTFSPE